MKKMIFVFALGMSGCATQSTVDYQLNIRDAKINALEDRMAPVECCAFPKKAPMYDEDANGNTFLVPDPCAAVVCAGSK